LAKTKNQFFFEGLSNSYESKTSLLGQDLERQLWWFPALIHGPYNPDQRDLGKKKGKHRIILESFLIIILFTVLSVSLPVKNR
jgi:hypothetical protein